MSLSSPRFQRATAAIAVCVLGSTIALTGCSSDSKSTSKTSNSSSVTSLTTSINDLIKAGIAYASAGKYTEANATFQNVISLDNTNKFAYYNLGVIAALQKNDTLAVTDYNTAIKIDQAYTPALYNKAIILEGTDLGQAISIYKSIIAINPKASTAYLRLSYAYSAQGKTADSSAAHAKAIALDPALASAPAPTPSPSAS